ncbi:MAG: DUF192 domain-containing protein [Balneolaceae bacterium]|jgi:uncharacterized membrane protein (UPF0127 family)
MMSACSHPRKNSKEENNDRSKSIKFVSTVSFLSSKGDTVSVLNVAIADDESERSEGLMDVRNLPESKGMLFIFDHSEPRSFWMANTPLPLDIIFVNENFEIVRIHHNAQPFSEKSLPSGKPAKYVIETNGGYCVSHDIQEGMTVSLEKGNVS